MYDHIAEGEAIQAAEERVTDQRYELALGSAGQHRPHHSEAVSYARFVQRLYGYY